MTDSPATLECTACRGQADCWVCTGTGRLTPAGAAAAECRYCAGTGRCRGCAGSGRVPSQRTDADG